MEGEFDLNGILGKAKSAAAREEVSMPTAPGVLPEDIPEARQFLKNTIKKIIVYNNKITVTFNLKTINEK